MFDQEVQWGFEREARYTDYFHCTMAQVTGTHLFVDRIGEFLPYSLLDLLYSFIAKRIFDLCLQIAGKLGLEL